MKYYSCIISFFVSFYCHADQIRDPFFPAQTATLSHEHKPPRFTLNAIIMLHEKKIAHLVDLGIERRVQEGDCLDNFTITKIATDHIIMKDDTNTDTIISLRDHS